MSGRFNPHDPLRVGLEWNATRVNDFPIDYGWELGTRVVPTSTGVLESMDFYADGSSAAFTEWFLATLYEESAVLNTSRIYTTTVMVTGGSTDGAFTGGAVSVEQALAYPTISYGIQLSPNDIVSMQFEQIDFQIPNPRILNVAIEVDSVPITGAPTAVGFRWYLSGPGNWFTNAISAVTTTQRTTMDTGEIFIGAYNFTADPTDRRRRPWLVSDIDDLNSGAVVPRLANVNSSNDVIVSGVTMTITYCEENRSAVGGLVRSTAYEWNPGWQTGIEFVDVTTGSVGIAMLQGRPYVITLTRATEALVTSRNVNATAVSYVQSGDPRTIAAPEPLNDIDVECMLYSRLTNGVIVTEPTPVSRAWAIRCGDNGGNTLVYATQPYAQTNPSVTSPISQTIQSAMPGLYSHISFPVARRGQPGDLSITCDGRTAVLTREIFETYETDDDGYAVVTLAWDAPVSISAGETVTVTAITFSGFNRWDVPTLSTTSTDPDYNVATYGGTTLTANGDAMSDIAFNLLTAVPTVTGVSIGHGVFDLAPVDPECPGPDRRYTALDYASICWGDVSIVSGSPLITGSPLVTGFCAWDVERRDAVDVDWHRIAHVTSKDIRCVSDFESRFGVSTDYRVRLCRLDGVCGDWATVTGFVREDISTDVEDDPGCHGLIFTSNENPNATLAYPMGFNGSPTEDFTFVEAETVMLQRMHMRDYQVAFRPLERGGVRFLRTLLVNAGSVPPEILDRGFSDLRDLAWDTLSYVTVLDTRGARWFASIIVPTGTVIGTKHIYLAAVDIIETTNRPSVIDIGAV